MILLFDILQMLSQIQLKDAVHRYGAAKLQDRTDKQKSSSTQEFSAMEKLIKARAKLTETEEKTTAEVKKARRAWLAADAKRQEEAQKAPPEPGIETSRQAASRRARLSLDRALMSPALCAARREVARQGVAALKEVENLIEQEVRLEQALQRKSAARCASRAVVLRSKQWQEGWTTAKAVLLDAHIADEQHMRRSMLQLQSQGGYGHHQSASEEPSVGIR
jgi:hypothetical protein